MKNNTCSECGHYITSHSKSGCEVKTFKSETGKTELCNCTKGYNHKLVMESEEVKNAKEKS